MFKIFVDRILNQSIKKNKKFKILKKKKKVRIELQTV